MKNLKVDSVCALLSLGMVLLGTRSFADEIPPGSDPPFRGKMGLSLAGSVPDWPQSISAPKGAPSILLIMLGDTGYGDASAFGGPIQAPNLAANGLRYNRFHTAAACSSTRAALRLGRNHHPGYPGYNTILRKDTVSIGGAGDEDDCGAFHSICAFSLRRAFSSEFRVPQLQIALDSYGENLAIERLVQIVACWERAICRSTLFDGGVTTVFDSACTSLTGHERCA